MKFTQIPDRQGDLVTIFQCLECFCFVPDYFAQWDRSHSLEAQIKLHEEQWQKQDSTELAKVLVGTTKMVSDFRRWLPDANSSALVAEIGSGRGALLKALCNAGYHAIGCEPAPALAEMAKREFGLKEDILRCEPAEHFLNWLRDQDKQPSALFMWHILEHVVNPIALLRNTLDTMAPFGRVLMQLPLLQTPQLFTGHYFFASTATFEYLATLVNAELIHIDIDCDAYFVTAIFEKKDSPQRPLSETERETNIMRARAEIMLLRDKNSAIKAEIIAGQSQMINERGDAIATQSQMIDERGEAIATQTKMIKERDEWILDLQNRIANSAVAHAAQTQLINERDAWITDLQNQINHLEAQQKETTEIINQYCVQIKSMQDLIADHAQAQTVQAGMINERDAWIKDLQNRLSDFQGAHTAQTQMINDRDAWIEDLQRRLNEAVVATQQQTRLIDDRDGYIKELLRERQTFIEERDSYVNELLIERQKLIEERDSSWIKMLIKSRSSQGNSSQKTNKA